MARISNSQTLGDVIREFINRYRLEDKLTESWMANKLEKMFGPSISRHISGVRIQHDIVIITIGHAALKHELSYSKSKLLEKINEELGREHFRKIVIR